MKKRALCVGSIAYDVIFSVHNNLKDEVVIENNAVKDISMMLTAENKQVFYGGTAGNIAYGLGIQGENPLLFSVVGDDFEYDYKYHLNQVGVDLKTVVKKDEYTATFYGISDPNKEQIGIFQPNTHGDYMHEIKIEDNLSREEIDSTSIGIFSPGTGESTMNHLRELRSLKGPEVQIIFDPSQVLSIFFTKDMLEEALSLSNIFIGNETEIHQLQNLLGQDISQILNHLDVVIETKGKDGSIIYQNSGETRVDAFRVDNFVEQTGAGDAFRAGFIKGMLNEMSIEDSCKVGSKMAAANVQVQGGQNYAEKLI